MFRPTALGVDASLCDAPIWQASDHARSARCMETKGKVVVDEPLWSRRLTPEEKQQALEAMDRAQELAKRDFEDRGGKLVPPCMDHYQ